MKIIVVILSFLILAPQAGTHIDIIAFDDIELHHQNDLNNFSDNHQIEHHQNDSDDEKDSEHHHHCIDLSVSTVFVASKNDYSLTIIPQEKKRISIYKALHGTNYLDSIFQPPQV